MCWKYVCKGHWGEFMLFWGWSVKSVDFGRKCWSNRRFRLKNVFVLKIRLHRSLEKNSAILGVVFKIGWFWSKRMVCVGNMLVKRSLERNLHNWSEFPGMAIKAVWKDKPHQILEFSLRDALDVIFLISQEFHKNERLLVIILIDRTTQFREIIYGYSLVVACIRNNLHHSLHQQVIDYHF